MSSVHVQTLTQRESNGIVVERGISRTVMYLNRRMCEPCHHFLDIPDTLDAGNRGTKGVAVPTKLA